MIYTIIAIFVILVFLDKALRLERKNLLNLETQYHLFALRDELRREETTEDSEFLDKLITVIAENLSEISALQMLVYHCKNVKRGSDSSKLKLETEIKLIESDKNLSIIYKKFTDELLKYLLKRYNLFISVAKVSLLGGLFGTIVILVIFTLIKKFDISLPEENHSLASH